MSRGRLVALLASGLLIAGCGSSSLEQGRLHQQGDAICKQTGAAVGKAQGSPKGNLKATATYLRASADLIDAELAKLRKLAKPKADERPARRSALPRRRRDLHAAARRRRRRRRPADSRRHPLHRRPRASSPTSEPACSDYGFTVCGT